MTMKLPKKLRIVIACSGHSGQTVAVNPETELARVAAEIAQEKVERTVVVSLFDFGHSQ